MSDKLHLTWGDALVVKVHRTRLGLKPLVDAIQRTVGRSIGSRTTFAKLYDVRRARDLDETEGWRAWLLLTALGEDPGEWDVREDVVVPRGLDTERLRATLRDLVGEVPRHQGLAAYAAA